MTGRRTIIGLCMLCALAFSAIAAQGASAATKGTTSFTCVNEGAGHQFADADCENKTGGSFEHVAFGENTETVIELNNTTIQKFKSTVAGTAFTLESNTLTGTGVLKNLKVLSGERAGEHYIHGTGIQLTYSGVTVQPPECGVTGLVATPGGPGMITTVPLTATTEAKGMALELRPETGTTFTEFEFTGATCALAGQKVKVVGSITLEPKGATLIAVHNTVTESASLHLGSGLGPVAGYEGNVTVRGGAPGGGKNALSVTTVETP